MSQMGIAYIAQHLDTLHAIGFVQYVSDYIFLHRLGKGRPARAGVELQSGVEQFRAAANAGVYTWLMRFAVLAAERRFSPMISRDAKLFWRQDLFPFGFCLVYFSLRCDILLCISYYISPVHRVIFCLKISVCTSDLKVLAGKRPCNQLCSGVHLALPHYEVNAQAVMMPPTFISP